MLQKFGKRVALAASLALVGCGDDTNSSDPNLFGLKNDSGVSRPSESSADLSQLAFSREKTQVDPKTTKASIKELVLERLNNSLGFKQYLGSFYYRNGTHSVSLNERISESIERFDSVLLAGTVFLSEHYNHITSIFNEDQIGGNFPGAFRDIYDRDVGRFVFTAIKEIRKIKVAKTLKSHNRYNLATFDMVFEVDNPPNRDLQYDANIPDQHGLTPKMFALAGLILQDEKQAEHIFRFMALNKDQILGFRSLSRWLAKMLSQLGDDLNPLHDRLIRQKKQGISTRSFISIVESIIGKERLNAHKGYFLSKEVLDLFDMELIAVLDSKRGHPLLEVVTKKNAANISRIKEAKDFRTSLEDVFAHGPVEKASAEQIILDIYKSIGFKCYPYNSESEHPALMSANWIVPHTVVHGLREDYLAPEDYDLNQTNNKDILGLENFIHLVYLKVGKKFGYNPVLFEDLERIVIADCNQMLPEYRRKDKALRDYITTKVINRYMDGKGRGSYVLDTRSIYDVFNPKALSIIDRVLSEEPITGPNDLIMITPDGNVVSIFANKRISTKNVRYKGYFLTSLQAACRLAVRTLVNDDIAVASTSSNYALLSLAQHFKPAAKKALEVLKAQEGQAKLNEIDITTPITEGLKETKFANISDVTVSSEYSMYLEDPIQGFARILKETYKKYKK